MKPELDELGRYLAADSKRESPGEMTALLDVLRERFGSGLAVVLFYGSCLRSRDLRDGIVDLHVIVDDYSAYGDRLLSCLNRWLAPNVFYLSVTRNGKTLRAKYNVFALDHLPRLVAPGRLAVFTWARLAQRAAVLYGRDEESLARVHALRAQAVRTFAGAAAPLCGYASEAPAAFWQRALQLSFGAELRAESRDRARQLVAADPDYFAAISMRLPARGELPGPEAARRRWLMRRVVGKSGSLLRLVKGWYTFDGGIDYLVWKLERHSGRQITVPDRVRRRPALYIWGFAWRLYRQGIFR